MSLQKTHKLANHSRLSQSASVAAEHRRNAKAKYGAQRKKQPAMKSKDEPGVKVKSELGVDVPHAARVMVKREPDLPCIDDDSTHSIIEISDSSDDIPSTHARRESLVDDCDKDHPAATHLVYPAAGAKLSLLSQNVKIQAILRTAMQSLPTLLYFEDAFPDASNRNRKLVQMLIDAADILGHQSIRSRLEHDVTYAGVLTKMVCQLFPASLVSRILIVL